MTDLLSDESTVGGILEIAAACGATSVKIFGSRARGDARPDSDLDLLVELRAGTTLFDLIGMEARLSELLGIDVDVISVGGLHPRIKDEILEEARPLVVAA